jgi:hydroxylamine reductase
VTEAFRIEREYDRIEDESVRSFFSTAFAASAADRMSLIELCAISCKNPVELLGFLIYNSPYEKSEQISRFFILDESISNTGRNIFMEHTSMYCDQCQEAAGGTACTRIGMCGIEPELASLRDLLTYVTQGLGAITSAMRDDAPEGGAEKDAVPQSVKSLIAENLVMTTVNVNFDPEAIKKQITKTLACREELLASASVNPDELPEAARWSGSEEEYAAKAATVGTMATEDADIRGLRSMTLLALRGIAAYVFEADKLGKYDSEIDAFIATALTKTADDDVRGGELIANVLETGRYGIKAMTILRKARAERYGTQEAIEVDLGVRNNPAILVAGDSYRDLEELLHQTEGSGVDVYTYSSMLSAHAHPEFSKYPHFAGNYGGAWWQQKEEFESFNGPILVTSDEFTVPRASYKNRVFTTGVAGCPGCTHIDDAPDGQAKDFSAVIELAKTCEPPKELRRGSVVTGYGKEQLISYSKQLSAALNSHEIRKVVLMLGTDGRAKSRSYYTDFVRALPDDVVVLTAGSIKYRFNDLDLGETNGIPRLLDAGDCADSYSIAELMLTLLDDMNYNDVGLLPMYVNVAWYDPKSIITVLELLYIGMKNLHLGPTTLTFLSKGIRDVFINYFGLKEIGDVDEEVKASFGDRGDAVTGDMIMGDIVAKFPELIPTMLSVGLHCLGCGVSQMESLKEACEVHGLDPYDILEVLNDELRHPSEA